MRLLFDQTLSHKPPGLLADLFPGSSQVRLLNLEQADHHRIWDVAKAEEYAIVTLDADVAELAQLRDPPPKVIWLRCGNQPTGFVADLHRRQAAAVAAFDADGAAACPDIS